MRAFATFLAATALVAPAYASAQAIPAETARIIAEGTTNSEVMKIAQYLTDVIGPRLTVSPGMRRAEAWTAAKFSEWGLANVHKEGFEFGRGWESQGASMRMIEPRFTPLTIAPIVWTPGTDGVVRAPVILAQLTDEASFAKYRGKLAGKLVLISDPEPPKDGEDAPFKRWNDDDLAKADKFDFTRRSGNVNFTSRQALARAREAFLKAEGAVAYGTMSGRPNKIVHGQGSRFLVGDSPALPGFEIAQEDYRRLVRLEAMGAAPIVELSSQVRYDDSDPQGYNIFADIPGTDARAGYVMAGAHLDSWVVGDGAVDNAAGSAMIIEAARIIKASGIKTKRTIRFALWSGEEQGLFGSQDYVQRYIASRPVEGGVTGIKAKMAWGSGWPITPLPGHSQLAAYFNLDNGSGKIRGINAQNNAAAAAIFTEWFKPFHSMGAETVAIRKSGGTDHVYFDAVGIPAFQFIQDPLDYGSLRHHTNLDTFDAMRGEDMRQGAIILAAFLINAANADKPLPRLPIATKQPDGDYYGYKPAGAGN